MNKANVWRVVALALVAVAIAAAAFQFGVWQGLQDSGKWVVPPGAHEFYWHAWPHFFFFPSFLWLLFIFLIVRAAFGGHRYRRWYGCDGVPPAFEEWHRRAHERGTPSNTLDGANPLDREPRAR